MIGTVDAEAAEDTTEPEGGPAFVHVDRIGTPRRPSREETGLVLAVGLPEVSLRRLTETGAFEVTDDPERVAEAAAVLVSTRLGRSDLRQHLAAFSTIRCPLVVLAHTGGETLAVDVMRSGGTAALAEGNEAALVALLDGEGHDAGLVDAYARNYGHAVGRGTSGTGRDPATGLLDGSRFEEYVDEVVSTGDVPRVVFVRLPRLATVHDRIGVDASALLRRRLAAQFRQIAGALDTELFAITPDEFAVVGTTLTPNQAERLGAALQRVAATYTAGDSHPLEVAVGHAGSEVATDAAMLRELAQRALQVAVADPARRVLGADTLSVGASAATELETDTRIIDHVEQRTRFGQGHGARVATYAAQLAHDLGVESAVRVGIELAARMHDLGKIALPVEAMDGPGGLDGELLEAYRSHPIRGWSALRASAGDAVAATVRAQHEHWDGTGFPDGLHGEAIPFTARLLATAHALEEIVVGGGGGVDELLAMGGTRLDPDLVEPAARLLGQTRAGLHGAA